MGFILDGMKTLWNILEDVPSKWFQNVPETHLNTPSKWFHYSTEDETPPKWFQNVAHCKYVEFP